MHFAQECAQNSVATACRSRGDLLVTSSAQMQEKPMHSPKNTEVRRILFENLIAAASLVKTARTEFIKATGDVPGDLPGPDENQRIREVSRKLVDARERM